MAIDYRRIFQEFDRVKHLQEYREYESELEEIDRILNSIPFDSNRAAQVCSYLANKYETDINQQPFEMGEKMTVRKGQNLPPKDDSALVRDLRYFKMHIPLFALKREIKSDFKKVLLGL